jgi:glycosyltransferase involved in cell wall biosynthesis
MKTPSEGYVGGAERQCWLLARGLTERGHRVLMISTRSSGTRQSARTAEGVEIQALPTDVSEERRTAELETVLKTHGTDVCYARDFSWFPATVAACERVGVASALNYYSLPQCGGLSLPILLASAGRLSPSSVGRWVKDLQQVRRVNDGAAGGATLRIVQTIEQSEALHRHYDLDACVIPNMQPVTAPGAARTAEKTKLLWVGKTFKRPGIFLAIAKAWESRRPDVRFVLVCRLDAHSRRDRALAARAKRLSNVIVVDDASQEDMERLYATAHIYVNTSLAEGFPNTFLEAWSASTPVLSLLVNPDGVLEREGVGISCGGDRSRFEAELTRLVDDRGLRETMGATARAYATTAHDPDAIIGRFESVFEGIAPA